MTPETKLPDFCSKRTQHSISKSTHGNSSHSKIKAPAAFLWKGPSAQLLVGKKTQQETDEVAMTHNSMASLQLQEDEKDCLYQAARVPH